MCDDFNGVARKLVTHLIEVYIDTVEKIICHFILIQRCPKHVRLKSCDFLVIYIFTIVEFESN